MGELNTKQKEIKQLWEVYKNFDLDEALEKFASKPKGRPPGKKPVPENIDTADSAMREGRFLLEHLENVNVPMVRKQCKQCGEDFLASYKHIALCSDTCRAAYFQKKYGFVWKPERTENERWEFWKVPPSIISPATLKRLEAFARAILQLDSPEEDAAQTSSEIGGTGTTPRQRLPADYEVENVTNASRQNPSELRRLCKEGKITPHELQEQLTAIFRG